MLPRALILAYEVACWLNKLKKLEDALVEQMLTGAKHAKLRKCAKL